MPTFDVVLDPLGGKNWRISYGLLRPGGGTVNYGASNAMPDGRRSLPAFAKAMAVMPRPSWIKQLWEAKGVLGLSMPALWEDRGSYGSFLDPLVGLIEDGTIEPVIDTALPFEQAPDAHRRLMEHQEHRQGGAGLGQRLAATERETSQRSTHTDRWTRRRDRGGDGWGAGSCSQC